MQDRNDSGWIPQHCSHQDRQQVGKGKHTAQSVALSEAKTEREREREED